MDKVLPKIVKRGDEQGKMFAQKVLANAAAASKQKSIDRKSLQLSEHKEATAKKSLAGPKTSSESAVASRKGGEAGSQPTKKGTTASLSTSAGSATTNAKGASLPLRKASATEPKAVDKGAQAANAAKVKTNVVAPKATNFFSSLQSASKKPGTSNAALKSAKLKDVKDGYVC